MTTTRTRPAPTRSRGIWLGALALLAAAMPLAAAQEEVIAEPRVWILHFELGGSQLSTDHHARLDEVAQRLLEQPRRGIKIVGHSDDQGSEEANLLVSRQRAEAVAAYLARHRAIAEQRMEVSAKGSLRPVASNDTPGGRLRNRRVVLALTHQTAAARRLDQGIWVLHFDYGGSNLSPANVDLLDEAARELRYNPELRAVVVGHSDNSGPESLNQQLSLERAETVKRHLTRAGIAEERIRTQGRGSLRPVVSNDDPEGQRRNRRAVIKLEPLQAADSRPLAEGAPPGGSTLLVEDQSALEEPSDGQIPGDLEPRRGKLRRSGRRVSAPVLLSVPDPVLPAGAAPPDRQLAVTVAVLVDEQGRSLVTRIVGDAGLDPGLREAALAAARAASFEPATRNGVLGRMWTEIVVRFAVVP